MWLADHKSGGAAGGTASEPLDVGSKARFPVALDLTLPVPVFSSPPPLRKGGFFFGWGVN